VRVVAAGVAGGEMDRITVQDAESPNFYQRHDYKILAPDAADKNETEKYWDTVPALQDMPVIGFPEWGDTVRIWRDETLGVKGYALPHGPDGPVVKVEVSVDDGISWQEAEISSDQNGDGRWAWVLWQAFVKPPARKTGNILSGTTDKVAYNGYGEVRDLTVETD
jgi:sulfite oxidase